MEKCWEEAPEDRPTFQTIRESFEAMMSRENPYIDFSVLDESKEYYNVPSFNSAPDEDEKISDASDGNKEEVEKEINEKAVEAHYLVENSPEISPLSLGLSKPKTFLDIEAAVNRRSTLLF